MPTNIEYQFIIRRHWVDTEPLTELSSPTWGIATFESGSFEIDVALVNGDTKTEKGTVNATSILDGKGGFRDEFIDEATKTHHRIISEGFWVEEFGILFVSDDGSGLDDHLVFPESIDLVTYDRAECFVVWRDGNELPWCPVGDCHFGVTRGILTSTTTEPHDEDHGEKFQITAGLNDAWVSADAPFQGLFFTVYEDIGLFFLSWFTFDSDIPPGDGTAVFSAPDQRWVTGTGFYEGSSVTVNMELTSGGIFNASEPIASQRPGYGTIELEFTTCNEALMSYEFPEEELSGEMTLTRVLEDNVALCEVLNSD